MNKINLRLITMIPALFACDAENDVRIKVVGEDGESITDYKPTLEDVSNDIFGVENIYAYENSVILEVKRDADNEDIPYTADTYENMYRNGIPIDESDFATPDYVKNYIDTATTTYVGPQLVQDKISKSDGKNIDIVDLDYSFDKQSSVTIIKGTVEIDGERKEYVFQYLSADYEDASVETIRKLFVESLRKRLEKESNK